jgi:hypothetical protein
MAKSKRMPAEGLPRVIPAGGQGRNRRLLSPRSTRPLSGDASRGDLERATHLLRDALHSTVGGRLPQGNVA